MTEKSAAPRVALIAGGVIIAIAAISLLVYFLAQPSGDPGTASDPTTTETPQATDEPNDDDSADADASDAEDDTDQADGSTEGGADEPDQVDGKKTYLDKEMSGQDAIDALGDDIDEVAERNGRTVQEFEDLLLKNPSAHVTPDGFVVYRDSFSNDDD